MEQEPFEKITQTQLMEYAQISGDLNPIHIDEGVAKELGYQTNFAHGMLILGLITRWVQDRYKSYQLSSINTRFISPIYKEESLYYSESIKESEVLDVEIISEKNIRKLIATVNLSKR